MKKNNIMNNDSDEKNYIMNNNVYNEKEKIS